MKDTYERSCEHWSESARTEMEAFYTLASVDYRHLAESRDWGAWLSAHRARVDPEPLRLLDVACGSGKFPSALLARGNLEQVGEVSYDLLDPSQFSVDEARRVLEPPFVPRGELVLPLQALSATAAYDLAWATHALYAIPAPELDAALQRLLRAMRPGGEIFIAHALHDGHYLEFYRRFLEDFRDGGGTPYCSAEEIVAAFERLGVAAELQPLEYTNGASDQERDAVQGFLQRCVFDDTVSLQALLDAPRTGPYLEACRRGGDWRFPQRVGLITVRL